jgi:anaerobic selenocysteine-containing dehydrogenase
MQHYSRRDFLKIAAVLPVMGTTWLFASAARAGAAAKEAYTQAQADAIHNHSTEEAIRQRGEGETPEEVKAEVERRLLALKANAAG